MGKKELNVIVTLAVVIAVFLGVLSCGMIYVVIAQHAQLTEIRAALSGSGLAARFRHTPMPGQWTSAETAAADSVEGQLRSQGKHWVRTTGEITAGAYVEDTLEGRMDQPPGRGGIAKVLSVNPGEGDAIAAQVDFGRGYVVGVNLSELSLVRLVP